MAAFSTIAAIAAVAATGYSIQQQQEAKKEQKKVAKEQRKIQSEQRAQNEAAASQERRKQLREERIRRSKILASSEAVGAAGSSGEVGALGGLSTTLSSNFGTNLASLNSAANISLFSQNAANFSSAADQANANAQMGGQVAGLAFQAAPVLEKARSLFAASKPTTTTPKA